MDKTVELVDVTPSPQPKGLPGRVWARATQPHRPLTRARKAFALAIAAAADALQLAFMPLFGEGIASPLDDILDGAVVISLVALVGFRGPLMLALVAELVPGWALFPTWTGVVMMMDTEPSPTAGPRSS